jgi:hypothetical protein
MQFAQTNATFRDFSNQFGVASISAIEITSTSLVLELILISPAIIRADLNHKNADGTIDIKGAIASSRPGSLHLSMDQTWIRMAPS